MTIVVVGGGIVGLTAAYYLTKKGKSVTLVEKCAIACHSSGKAGGFLTDGSSSWHQGAVAHLAKQSFTLHEELAKEFGPETIGYRRVRCVGRTPPGRKGDVTRPSPDWLTAGEYEQDMGSEHELAQVTPYKLMDALHAAVLKAGCTVVIGKVLGVVMASSDDAGKSVAAVRVEQEGKESTIACEALILGMGVWAAEAAGWFPDSSLPKDTVSHRYTSVIWDDVEVGKAATMVFTMGRSGDTEIYPRTNECYANGCPSSPPLPDNPLEIVPPDSEVERVKAETIAAVGRLKDATVIRTTACFLAGSDDGGPVIGLVPGVRNAAIACGGGCWGILNGPAMGQAAAALVLGEEPAVRLSPFSPERFSRSRHAGDSRLPPKLRALVAQNPGLAEMLRANPDAVEELLQMIPDDGA